MLSPLLYDFKIGFSLQITFLPFKIFFNILFFSITSRKGRNILFQNVKKSNQGRLLLVGVKDLLFPFINYKLVCINFYSNMKTTKFPRFHFTSSSLINLLLQNEKKIKHNTLCYVITIKTKIKFLLC